MTDTTMMTQIAAALEALNQRDMEDFMALVDEDAALDMPDGSRVIGAQSLRDTLSAYLLHHDLRFADSVIMVDTAGLRGAADLTVKGEMAGGDAGDSKAFSLPAVIVFEREATEFSRISLYLSTPL